MRATDIDASCGIVCGGAPPAHIERLLESLAASRPRLAVYLVGPGQPALTALAQRYAATWLDAPLHLGQGHARNLSLRAALAARHPYHFLFTPDIALPQDAVGKLLAWMDAHPDAGLLAPRIRHPDGRLQPLCSLLPGPLDVLLRRCLPLLYRSSGAQARFELHAGGYREVMDVPVLPGCCLLVRTAIAERVGLCDERLLRGFDTVDLARRIAPHARCVFLPHAGVVRDPARAGPGGWRAACHDGIAALRYFGKWGWWRDEERERVNARTLRALGIARGVVRSSSGAAVAASRDAVR
jgi:GT2 family glycosyltransferase